MPRLPSGREIAITARRVSEIAEQYEQTGEPMALAGVRTMHDLYPYIDVMYFRPQESASATDAYLPVGLEPYASGYTLADVDLLTRDWPEPDREAFQAFLAEERTRKHLARGLERVRLAQLARAELTPATLLQAIALTEPQLFGIDNDVQTEEPLALEPQRLEAATLVAMARVACRAPRHEHLYALHGSRFERARAFVRLALDHDRELLRALLDQAVALDVAAARLRTVLAVDDFPDETKRWIERQLWHEVASLWPALDSDEGRTAFPREYAVLEQAWVSPQLAQALDEALQRR